jgi:hypothetical protein
MGLWSVAMVFGV